MHAGYNLLAISIHAAREGGDARCLCSHTRKTISIHAAREGGDNPALLFVFRSIKFQSTPPVKAATRCRAGFGGLHAISIHAAREGGDSVILATGTAYEISIHAAREGGDAATVQQNFGMAGFQSTPPVKAATVVGVCRRNRHIFQSTPPVKAATEAYDEVMRQPDISIHAAREGGDPVLF